jgi:hypothetical protein
MSIAKDLIACLFSIGQTETLQRPAGCRPPSDKAVTSGCAVVITVGGGKANGVERLRKSVG